VSCCPLLYLIVPRCAVPCCAVLCAAMCKPNSEGTGWLYSAALCDVVRQYRAAFPSLFAALDPSSGGAGAMMGGGGGGEEGERQKLRVSDLFPHAPPERHDTLLQEVGWWCGRVCVGGGGGAL
jgi:hypothetical protein